MLEVLLGLEGAVDAGQGDGFQKSQKRREEV